MDSSKQTRQLVPLFVEKIEGQDIRDLVYFRGEDGAFKSLAELQPERSAEFPGMLTTSIIETSSAEGGKVSSVLVSPFRLCCVVIGGTKICYQC